MIIERILKENNLRGDELPYQATFKAIALATHDKLFIGIDPARVPSAVRVARDDVLFVPEAELSKMQPGRSVSVTFDGAAQPLNATINYISTRAEFTPPVIYSQQTRTKLVFMVEAKFATNFTIGLRPGQPVEVAMQR